MSPPGKTDIFGQCGVVWEVADITYFGDYAGAEHEAEARHRVESMPEVGQFLGNSLINDTYLLFQAVNGLDAGSQDQVNRKTSS